MKHYQQHSNVLVHPVCGHRMPIRLDYCNQIFHDYSLVVIDVIFQECCLAVGTMTVWIYQKSDISILKFGKCLKTMPYAIALLLRVVLLINKNNIGLRSLFQPMLFSKIYKKFLHLIANFTGTLQNMYILYQNNS